MVTSLGLLMRTLNLRFINRIGDNYIANRSGWIAGGLSKDELVEQNRLVYECNDDSIKL